MHVNHVALWVSDIERSKAFYARLGGQLAPKGYHNPRSGLCTWFVTFEPGGCRLELMQRPDVDNRGVEPAYGWAHLAISLGAPEAVDALVAELTAEGIECLSGPRVTGDGYYEAVIADPEGNMVELVA